MPRRGPPRALSGHRPRLVERRRPGRYSRPPEHGARRQGQARTWIDFPPPIVTANELMFFSATAAALGYQTLPSSLSVTQLPASVRFPAASVTQSSHVVPTGMPVTSVLTCVPQPIARQLTVAVMPAAVPVEVSHGPCGVPT